MCCALTRNKAIFVTIAETIVVGALTTGAIIGAIAVGSTLATVALSVGAAVAGIFTLLSIGNIILLKDAETIDIISKNWDEDFVSPWSEVHTAAFFLISDFFFPD